MSTVHMLKMMIPNAGGLARAIQDAVAAVVDHMSGPDVEASRPDYFPCKKCGAMTAVDADDKCVDVLQELDTAHSQCPVDFECEVIMDHIGTKNVAKELWLIEHGFSLKTGETTGRYILAASEALEPKRGKRVFYHRMQRAYHAATRADLADIDTMRAWSLTDWRDAVCHLEAPRERTY